MFKTESGRPLKLTCKFLDTVKGVNVSPDIRCIDMFLKTLGLKSEKCYDY